MDVSVGVVSSRGQIAIPSDIRRKMGLSDGAKILFLLDGDSLSVRRLESVPWEKLTAPLRAASKKLKEADMAGLVHNHRARRPSK
ncbi:MAG: AbrB/MazE/SpoVT family DNA-binding domain-containing protein [Candidatus Micrarchaeia archaeon]|jgi:AbrB family looped-hinge helix DNA binding protein